MFTRILVPLDGSSLAEAALPAASSFALRFQAIVILFHVLEKGEPDSVHGQRHISQADEARLYLEKLASRMSADGVKVQIEIHEDRQSNVALSIIEHARELNADLVVLCAHGKGGLRDVIFGCIAQQVIQQETIPVLFIRPDQDGMVRAIQWNSVLVPLDGSPVHEAALPYAKAIATQSGAQIRLLTVVPTIETLRSKEAAVSMMLPASSVMALDLMTQESQEYLQQIVQEVSALNLPVSGVIQRGDPVARINETVENEKVDLIVMATFGHRNFDAFWEESVTPKVLAASPVPVLFVRESEAR